MVLSCTGCHDLLGSQGLLRERVYHPKQVAAVGSGGRGLQEGDTIGAMSAFHDQVRDDQVRDSWARDGRAHDQVRDSRARDGRAHDQVRDSQDSDGPLHDDQVRGVPTSSSSGPAPLPLTGEAARAALPALAAFDFPCALVVTEGGSTLLEAGEVEEVLPLASVTKLVVAWAALVAVERAMLDLDASAGGRLVGGGSPGDGLGGSGLGGGSGRREASGTAGRDGALVGGGAAGSSPACPTVRHLLAHASGIAPDSDDLLARPGTRRIYSNRGFEVLGERLEEATGMPLEAWLETAVLEPLGMASVMVAGSAAHSGEGSARDLALLAVEMAAPRLVSASLALEACQPVLPGLDGVLPGYGRQSPNDFGLGVEIRGHKNPHWTGAANSPRTFGHFGQSGSFVWVDPVAGRQAVFLGSRPFGAVHKAAWPGLSDQILGL